MVKELRKDEKTIFVCEVCGFGYEDEKTASECEEYCSNNNACSIEITKKAIYYP